MTYDRPAQEYEVVWDGTAKYGKYLTVEADERKPNPTTREHLNGRVAHRDSHMLREGVRQFHREEKF